MDRRKNTDWYELNPDFVTVHDTDKQTLDNIVYTSVKISHPDLPTKRALWFTSSRAGNLYYRKLNKTHENATAYIIKDGIALLPYFKTG